jgi:hypothetical protein
MVSRIILHTRCRTCCDSVLRAIEFLYFHPSFDRGHGSGDPRMLLGIDRLVGAEKESGTEGDVKESERARKR